MQEVRIYSSLTNNRIFKNRNYLARMNDEKVACMIRAKKYDYDYWDGEKKYGYGGYSFKEGYWQPFAKALIDKYNLNGNSKILDIGCGKGYLLYEIKNLIPSIQIFGIDISKYAIENAHPLVKNDILNKSAYDTYPFDNNYFDLAISLNTLHNLPIYNLDSAINEIKRVSKQSYLLLESFNSEQQLFNLQCWSLTCETFFDTKSWNYILNKLDYQGDYEFNIFN